MIGKLSIKIEQFRPMRAHTLYRGVNTLIVELGLRIKELTIHESHGRRWVGFPARPQLDKDGWCIVDARGRRHHTNILQFNDRLGDRFSDRVIAELTAAHRTHTPSTPKANAQ